MAQVNLTNLTASTLSLDITVGDVTLREDLAPGETKDVGDRITMDELNESSDFKALLAANRLQATSEAEASDVAVEQKLMMSVILGTPVIADVDRIVTSVALADGAATLAAQPDVPRNLTMVLLDADDSATSTITAIGLDPAGRTVTETMLPDGAGGGKTLTGTKIFASVTSVTVSGTAGATGADLLEVGVGDLIGLPSDITLATAVKHTYLGGVRLTPDAVAVGASLSGVNATSGTYDGSKLMQVLYNTGE